MPVARIAKPITNGSLVVTGDGLLELTGSNSFSQLTIGGYSDTRVRGSGALPSTANLTFDGGVFELTGNFSRALGTGAGQVQWINGTGGGFGAVGADRTVNIGGVSELSWGQGF